MGNPSSNPLVNAPPETENEDENALQENQQKNAALIESLGLKKNNDDHPAIQQLNKKLDSNEGWGEYVLRQGARVGSRAGETFFGLLGDARETRDFMGDYISKSIAASIPEMIGEDNWNKILDVYDSAKPAIDKIKSINKLLSTPGQKILQAAPTSSELEEYMNEFGGGYLKPQNKIEELIDETTKDLTALAIPLPGQKISFAARLGRSLLPAIGGVAAKEFIKGQGGSEFNQIAAKLGANIVLTMVNPSAAREYVRQLGNKARQAIIPGDGMVSDIRADVENLIKSKSKGGVGPIKKLAVEPMENFLLNSQQGNFIEAEELMNAREMLNEFRAKNPFAESKVRQAWTELDSIFNKELNRYGNQQNKPFLDAYHKSQTAARGMHEGNRIADFIRRKVNVDKIPKAVRSSLGMVFASSAGASLSKSGAFGTMAGAGLGLGAYGLGYGMAGSIKAIRRFSTNPVWREYYINTLKAAAKGDVALANKELAKLSESWRKSESNNESKKKPQK